MTISNQCKSAISLDELSTDEFLQVVGQRVRFHRTSKRMSRKLLAETSGVSERYLAQLEAGQGNMSIALLRKVTAAIDLPLGALMADETPAERRVPKKPEPAMRRARRIGAGSGALV